MTNLLALNRQSYRDHCLIVIGPGTLAEKVLAKRRLNAGGRLLHVLTDQNDQNSEERVVVKAFQDLEGCFFWQPPKRKSTAFAQRLRRAFRTHWSSTGPDSFELKPKETLEILMTGGRMHHIRLFDAKGCIEAEMSGEIVLKPDMQLAQDFDVQVMNPDLKSCGTFSLRWMILSILLLLLWHTVRQVVSIHFELHAETGDFPWWRALLTGINSAVFCGVGLGECVSLSFAGLPPTYLSHCVGIFAGTLVCSGLSALHAADVVSSIVGGLVLGAVGSGILYVRSGRTFPERRWPSCLAFALANITGTAGPGLLASVIIWTYTFLLDTGLNSAATLFLPIATALSETLCVFYAKTIYSALVVAKRPAVPGDTALVNMPWMLIAAHGCAESARMVGMFSSAVRDGEFTWVGAACLTFMLNVLSRLGWLRWLAFQFLKRSFGVRIARAIAAPTAWSKLHDEVKIYVGYIRYIIPLALAASRAIYYHDISWDGPYMPIFSFSAGCALLCILLFEILEDVVGHQRVPPSEPHSKGGAREPTEPPRRSQQLGQRGSSPHEV